MIYDCFTFNDELDLLELRLEFLSPYVDKFVLIESEFTFTGKKKPLHFKLNKARYNEFANKIIHASIPLEAYNKDNAWQNEYYQRNFVKTQLNGLNDDDIVHLCDLDEIPNFEAILKAYSINRPYLIELPVYYYFFNLRSDASFKANLLTPYRFIKEVDLGKREMYFSLAKDFIELKDIKTGWHFSYLFGYEYKRYQDKIHSFSHTEYNTPYYTNEKRIATCVRLGIDLFERWPIKYWITDKNDLSPKLLTAIKKCNLQEYFFDREKAKISSLKDLIYNFKANYWPGFKSFLRPVATPIARQFRTLTNKQTHG